MLTDVSATLAICLWLASYGLYFARDLYRWWRLRPYRQAMSEYERLEEVRTYAAWVRNMPPAPPRRPVGPVVVPVPVVPPVRGVAQFPGRIFSQG